jgi:hypothetical protein
MNIYLIKNGQNAGPYTETEVLARLNSGLYAATDLAWYEGCSEPIPLANLLDALKSKPTSRQSIAQSPTELAQLKQNQGAFTGAMVLLLMLAFIPLPEGIEHSVIIAASCVCLGAGWRLARSLKRKGWVWVLLLLLPYLSWIFGAYLIWEGFKTLKENKQPNKGLAIGGVS